VLIYLQGVPLNGLHTLALAWLTVEGVSARREFEAAVALSPGCRLRWAAFSEEGLLVTLD
jgi:hypothetical protein